MPRYFFALTDKDNLSLAADEVGEEFDLVEAARGHATAVARELSRNVLKRARIGSQNVTSLKNHQLTGTGQSIGSRSHHTGEARSD
jgi:uncharacterized protein DUF6894